jgi:hypothetical protein
MADEGEGSKGHAFHCAFRPSGPQFRASRKENVRRREVAFPFPANTKYPDDLSGEFRMMLFDAGLLKP